MNNIRILYCCLFIFASVLFAKRSFVAHDLITFEHLTSPAPHASGIGALFTTSKYDPSSNTVDVTLSYVSFETNEIRTIGVNVGKEPFWFSDDIIGVSKEINGTVQIWYAKFDATNPASSRFIQLTSYHASVANVKYHRSGFLAFTAVVYKGGSVVDKVSKTTFDSGTVYNKLFVRHWDKYIDPETFSQLFTVKVSINVDGVTLQGNPINLMGKTSLQTPVAPSGDANDYDISPDGLEIAFTSRVPVKSAAWNTNTDIYIVPSDGTSVPMSISAYNLGYDMHPKYSLDGSFIAWLQMPTPKYEADRNRIALFGRRSVINPSEFRIRNSDAEWDRSPESIVWTTTGLIITAQEMGRVKLFSVDMEGWVRPLVENGATHQVSFVKGSGLVFVKSSLTSPPNLYTLFSNKLQKRTDLNRRELDIIDVVEPEEFWFDGSERQVHGWLFKPSGFVEGVLYPMALLIHGGPEGAWNDEWGLRWNQQVFAGAGYVVITINPTGSTGYGSDFIKGILNNWGSLPYEDLMKGVDYAIDTYDYIDTGRLSALGASYGGYMINWINGHTDRFRCLVNHDGIFDTTGSFYNTDELWFPETEFGGIPYENSDTTTYEQFSPRNFVNQWKTPTLVIHSELDYRLPVTEGLSTFTALQRKGIKSRFLYFPDENHWVLKSANSLRWNQEVINWLQEWNQMSPSIELHLQE